VVIRHADRTPKQKVKLKVSHPRLLSFFDGKDPEVQVKLKTAKELQSLLDAVTDVINSTSEV